MMRRGGIKALILAAAVAVVWSPTPASADGFVSPWVGSNFAKEPHDGLGSFGVTAGSMGAGIIGGEFDFGYSPSFWDKDVFGNNNVLDLMGNVIVGIPIGGQRARDCDRTSPVAWASSAGTSTGCSTPAEARIPISRTTSAAA